MHTKNILLLHKPKKKLVKKVKVTRAFKKCKMMHGDKLQDGVNSKQSKRILISKILNINQYNIEYKLPLKHSVTACLQETKKN